ncbi:hypothetical protein PMKS-003182 [Pichia membranifaciens]|uniref:BZIP domain-containing protein n=1 Tax=Pichia membranifaciens TaxID=4926 RepID=A0A1Q2YJH0_9ASCO|nr:hypothetical protein PMKS-003182 [Pichia membranifaciens]
MANTKTQDHAAVEKPHTKPGRKPLTSEPKNKRTAQNRAAQRAFRERKEKRMLELEDKVRALEQEKIQIANESELLRIQVKQLITQLGRNGATGHINGTLQRNKSYPEELEKDDSSSVRRDSSSDEKSTNITSSNSSVSSATPVSLTEEGYNFTKPLPDNAPRNPNADYNLSLSNKLNNKSFKDHYDEQIFCKELGEVCGSTSCPLPKDKKTFSSSASPGTIAGNNQKFGSTLSVTSNGNNTSASSNNIAYHSASSMTTPSIDSSSRFNSVKSPFTNSLFGESVNGDQDILAGIAKDEVNTNDKEDTKANNSIWNIGKGLDSYAFLDSNKNNEMDFLFDDGKKVIQDTNTLIQSHPEAFQLDANSSLFNDNLTADFDADVEFDNDDVFDDLLKLPYDDVNFNNQLNELDHKQGESRIENASSANNSEAITDLVTEENEEVPDTTQNLMQCSQIWERITTHPRFTDLDIENLCDELKTKAKCSESGVVVDGSDVGKLLHQATCEKQKQKERERELAIKRAAISSDANTFLNGFW